MPCSFIGVYQTLVCACASPSSEMSTSGAQLYFQHKHIFGISFFILIHSPSYMDVSMAIPLETLELHHNYKLLTEIDYRVSFPKAAYFGGKAAHRFFLCIRE